MGCEKYCHHLLLIRINGCGKHSCVCGSNEKRISNRFAAHHRSEIKRWSTQAPYPGHCVVGYRQRTIARSNHFYQRNLAGYTIRFGRTFQVGNRRSRPKIAVYLRQHEAPVASMEGREGNESFDGRRGRAYR